MGNLQNKENINLANELDYIAANYIINNKEELDLTKDIECEKLVEKISDLLKAIDNMDQIKESYITLIYFILDPSSIYNNCIIIK